MTITIETTARPSLPNRIKRWFIRAGRHLSLDLLLTASGYKRWVESRSTRVDAQVFKRPVSAVGRDVLFRYRSTDLAVFHEVYTLKQYEISQLDIPQEYELILDLGAYTGLSTLFLTSKHPAARVVAVDADPRNYQLLLRNCSGLAQVACLRAALWDDEHAILASNPDCVGTWASRVAESYDATSSSETLPVVTMRQLLDRYETSGRIAVKMDVEGAEARVFERGCRQWLSRIDLLMIEYHDDVVPGSEQAIHDTLLAHGFRKHRGGAVCVYAREPSQPRPLQSSRA